MRIGSAYLTYCTNIHPAHSWNDVFVNLKKYVPGIKESLCSNGAFGIGLYLSNQASHEILEGEQLKNFKTWLNQNDLYVFTMNGFPYGDFHSKKIKDDVYKPDWANRERVNYSIRLFDILCQLLPHGMEGSISTSPVSYKYWFENGEVTNNVFEAATLNIIEVIKHLIEIEQKTGKVLHLDIEPEPDCALENSSEVVSFFKNWLLRVGSKKLVGDLKVDEATASHFILKHVRVCYDVCHFAVEFENHKEALLRFSNEGIKIGKFQISAALRASFSREPDQNQNLITELKALDEPTYLHQVVKMEDSTKSSFRDLSSAIETGYSSNSEWRTHFHVPIFLENYGLLKSTNQEIIEVLNIIKKDYPEAILEVETYTWSVIPGEKKTDLRDSITRELKWVKKHYEE